jgi:hypothetical protein
MSPLFLPTGEASRWGLNELKAGLFSDVDLEDRVTAKHPLLVIRRIVKDVLDTLDGEFASFAPTARRRKPSDAVAQAARLTRRISSRLSKIEPTLAKREFMRGLIPCPTVGQDASAPQSSMVC